MSETDWKAVVDGFYEQASAEVSKEWPSYWGPEAHAAHRAAFNRIFSGALRTEREMHNAWRKRAEEAEQGLAARVAALSEGRLEFDLDAMITAGPWKASPEPSDGTPPWAIGTTEPMFWFDTRADAERACGLLNAVERQNVAARVAALSDETLRALAIKLDADFDAGFSPEQCATEFRKWLLAALTEEKP